MTFQIISERETTLLVLENGKIKQLSKDFYNLIKVKRFNGERIIQTFKDKDSDDEIEVQETFNKGIFNVKYKNTIIQLRDRNVVCGGIENWYQTNDINKMVETFQEQYRIQEETKVFQYMANLFPDKRVVAKDRAFIVDGLWKIDNQGTAYINSAWSKYQGIRTGVDPHNADSKLKEDNKWKFLCIVPDGKIYATSIQTEIGEIKLTKEDVVILAKVGFLLDPKKIFDSVFMNQLTKKVKKVLTDEYNAQVKENK